MKCPFTPSYICTTARKTDDQLCLLGNASIVLEAWHLEPSLCPTIWLPFTVSNYSVIELTVSIKMHLTTVQKEVKKLACSELRALLCHVEVDKENINFDTTLHSRHCSSFMSSNFFSCIFPMCLHLRYHFSLPRCFQTWGLGFPALPLLNRNYDLWLSFLSYWDYSTMQL